MGITETEKRILQNIHFCGCMGNTGSMNIEQRRNVLQTLVQKELITEEGKLTAKGKDACSTTLQPR